MTEPEPGPARRSSVKRSLAPAAVATLLLLGTVGCGQQQGRPTASGSHGPDKVGSCATTDDGVVRALPVYVALHLDDNGIGDSMSVTRPDSLCPDIMFTKVAGRTVSLDLKGVRLDLRSARRVIVPGRDSDLVAIREVHPRGGFQEHLYGYAGGSLAEVTTSSGDTPVPFVATDTRGGYVSTSCVDNGFVVRQAAAHRPPGIVPTWDVRETTYTVDGTTARPAGTREIKAGEPDGDLARDYPELVGREMFRSGCAG